MWCTAWLSIIIQTVQTAKASLNVGHAVECLAVIHEQEESLL